MYRERRNPVTSFLILLSEKPILLLENEKNNMQYHYSFNRHRANLQASCESYEAADFDNWFWVKIFYLNSDGFLPMALIAVRHRQITRIA